MKAIMFCLVFILFFAKDSISGWEMTYGSVYNERGYSVDVTVDNGYVIVGTFPDIVTPCVDCWVIKIDMSGDTIWTRKYGCVDFDEIPYDITVTFDSGFVVTGYIDDSIEGSDTDLWIFKADKEGDSLWAKVYGGFSWESGHCIKQTSDSGYIVVGRTYSSDDATIWVLKLNSEGDTVWTHTYGEAWGGTGHWIDNTSDGGYIITGSIPASIGGCDLYLLKIDQYGDIQWSKTYGGWSYEWGRCVEQTPDHCYIITGQTSSFGSGNYNLYLIKTDEYGDSIWTKTFGGMEFDAGYSLICSSDQNVVVTGATESYGFGSYSYPDVWLMKVNKNGDTLWTKTFGGFYFDAGNSVTQTRDSGYIIAGWTNSFGEGMDDVYLLKTDSEGNITWINEIPMKPEEILINIYPNPFNSSCRIDAPLNAQIEIFDLLGKRIIELPPGTKIWTPDHSTVSGVYLVRATVESKSTSQKILYMK